MSPSFHLLDTVALLDDLPAHGLERGEVGVLVETLADGVWLVEFVDDEGRTLATPDLREEQLLRLRAPRTASAA
ncbi:DUF4926 domain-containing protein [Rubrivirga sp. IMCC45206]|uniref:DUF4926 domain-containing protein n=1 Tax=Rubrivirga sp. IMCC45206 TaxID=3391614 RepID=UPI00398F99B7